MIINLVGASGSGKTTLARYLDELDHFNVIHSYTTRKPRYDGEWGHRFIDDITQWVGDEKIAYAFLYGEHYFATPDQILDNYINIYVVDPVGANQVKNFYEGTDMEVITVYLSLDDDARLDRRSDVESRKWNDEHIFRDVDYDIKLDASKPPILVLEDFLEIFD